MTFKLSDNNSLLTYLLKHVLKLNQETNQGKINKCTLHNLIKINSRSLHNLLRNELGTNQLIWDTKFSKH